MRHIPKPGEGLSDRQRHLAELIAEGHSLKSAYKLAGYEGSTGVYSPNSIVNTPDFKYYLFHLRETAQERTYQTIELLVKQLDDARLLAIVEREPAAVIASVMAKARLLGLVGSDRADSEVLVINKPSKEPSTVVDLSVDEWQEKFGTPKRLQ